MVGYVEQFVFEVFGDVGYDLQSVSVQFGGGYFYVYYQEVVFLWVLGVDVGLFQQVDFFGVDLFGGGVLGNQVENLEWG